MRRLPLYFPGLSCKTISHDMVATWAGYAARRKTVACGINGNGNLSVSLTARNLADGVSATARFDHAAVAAALIRYCMEKKIPLAKAVEKSVQAEGAGVALTLRIPEN